MESERSSSFFKLAPYVISVIAEIGTETRDENLQYFYEYLMNEDYRKRGRGGGKTCSFFSYWNEVQIVKLNIFLFYIKQDNLFNAKYRYNLPPFNLHIF